MKLFGRKFGAVHWFMALISISAILMAIAILYLTAAGFLSKEFMNAYDVLFQILWFFLIFWIIYNLRLVLSFAGGKFSRGLFLITFGGLLFVLVALHRVLDKLDVSILSVIIPESFLDLTIKTVSLIGLVLVAWGLHELADLYREHS